MEVEFNILKGCYIGSIVELKKIRTFSFNSF